MFPQQIFESSKPFCLLGRRLDNSITTCCSLELWPQALGTDIYLIQRREVCAYQHQPTSTSLFPQNGCSHPSNYLRSFDWNVGTQVFPPKLTLHFQDTLYEHGLEFVIGKCRIKLHKINFFWRWPWSFFSPLPLIACWLSSIILVEMTEEEGTAININMWSKGQVAEDEEAGGRQ